MAQVSQPAPPYTHPSVISPRPRRSSSIPPVSSSLTPPLSEQHGSTNPDIDPQLMFITPVAQPATIPQQFDSGVAGMMGNQAPMLQYPAANVPSAAFAHVQSGVLPFISVTGFDLNAHQDIGNAISRPATAASGDTFLQAQTLFHDFDGAHYAPSIRESEKQEPSVLRTSPGLRPKYPAPAPGMVYYPAPVPMNLNLPKRLSTAIPPHVEAKRRSQVMSTIVPEARKSAVWINHERNSSSASLPNDLDPRKSRPVQTRLPAQLRASVFFEGPGTSQEIEIKDGSAMLTLEELLDASTQAPVSAFTDHMFAGAAGANVYKREVEPKRQSTMPTMGDTGDKKRRSSFLGLRRKSITSEIALNDDTKPTKRRWSRSFSLGAKLDDSALNRDPQGVIASKHGSRATSPLPGDGQDEEDSQIGDEDFDMPQDDDDLAVAGPPTTLLAELQMRKEAQKLRNRTALSAFPNGMHSTLLEMDAVAQIQKKKRQNARVTLAWENPDHGKDGKPDVDDEDVPLGVLFAGNGKVKEQLKERGMADWDRPLGLIELREREDNEPLSMRRARLKGVDPYQVQQPTASMIFALGEEYQDEEAIESDHEEVEETLAERLKRLKTKNQDTEEDDKPKSRPISKAFTEELLEELGIVASENTPGESPQPAPNASPEVPEEEETLGQRRARLQKMAKRPSMLPIQDGMYQSDSAIPQAPKRPNLRRASTSMADLLQSVPMGTTRKVSDKQLVENLPQDSLLKQSEEKRVARKDFIRGAMIGSTPLINIPDVDMGRNNGLKTGLANPGYNNAGPGLLGNHGTDVRQSMYGLGISGGANMTMPFGTGDLALQQAQMLNYQNAQIAQMMGLSLGMPIAQPSPPTMGAYPSNSTPNLLVANGMAQMSRQSSMQWANTVGTQGQQHVGMAEEPFLDANGRARIDAWRQSVQND